MHPAPEGPLHWAGAAALAVLSQRDFALLSRLIEQESGIRVPPSKKAMLEGRLRCRLRELGLTDFADYCQRVIAGADPAELVAMIDEVTTNKTDFFREPQHFTFLASRALPELLQAGHQEVRVWSAACSTGEEPYTLAMVLAEAALQRPALRWQVLASDLCTEALDVARAATYPADRVEPVPAPLRRRYLLRRRDGTPEVRIVPALRERVRLRRINLLDGDYLLGSPQQIVFCRNVFIYFRKELQAAILDRFCRCLSPGGYLFLGHSETINGFDVPLVQVAPTVYRKQG